MDLQLHRVPVFVGMLMVVAGLAVIAYAVLVWKWMEHSHSFVPDVVIIVGGLVMVLGINVVAVKRPSKSSPDETDPPGR